MRGSILETPTIGELNDRKKRFFIPDYQRGYRWTKTEVEALLEDILEFGEKIRTNGQMGTWYCIQPIVTKKVPRNSAECFRLDLDGDWYEVIDGQQRITTIFLITRFINQAWRGQDGEPEPLIAYHTRESASFLSSLVLGQAEPVEARGDIDLHHMWQAFECINAWAKGLPRGDPKLFIDTFLNHTRAIWYETEESDPVEVFTRLNIYKIPLTNAELVKALILNHDNFVVGSGNREEERIHLRQVEIASEWDAIETSLRDDAFWSFIIDPVQATYATRIELLLDLLADKDRNADQFHTFRYFRNLLAAKNDPHGIVTLWKEIKDQFMILEGWYHNRTLYHRIGYLIHVDNTGDTLKALLEDQRTSTTKTEFQETIRKRLAETMSDVSIDDMSYTDHRDKLMQVLLLHNIETMEQSEDGTARFPFDRFKLEPWDIEHVHAVADDAPTEYDAISHWCKETLPFVEDTQNADLVARLRNLQNTEKPDKVLFKKVYDDVIALFVDYGDYENDLSNLVLLDSRTNRSYKAAIFPSKRKRIIQTVKNGGFVPVCTRNVFLKFYSDDATQLHFWERVDREKYKANIKEILRPYLPHESNKDGKR